MNTTCLNSSLKDKSRRLHRKIEHLTQLDQRLSNLRLFIFTGGIVTTVITYVYFSSLLFLTMFFLFVAAFIYTARRQKKIVIYLKRFKSWQTIIEEQIARKNLQWDGIPFKASGEPVAKNDDIYLTGKKSLLHLTDTTITEGGWQYLQSWFLQQEPDKKEAQKRADIIEELKPLNYFREKLRIIVRSLLEENPYIQTLGLKHWVNSPKELSGVRRYCAVLSILSLATLPLLILYLTQIIPAYWVFPFFIYIIVFYQTRGLAARIFEESYQVEQGVKSLYEVLTFLEGYKPGGYPMLADVMADFRTPSHQPSHIFKKARRMVFWASLSQKNPLFWILFNAIGPWDFFFTIQLEKFKRKLKPNLNTWLKALHKLEALNAVANFGYLNPDYTKAQIVQKEGKKPFLKAIEMGHPLLPEDEKVRNTYEINQAGDIGLITGSNMSGKSTFLRTLAINIKLAMMGAPVDAASLQLVPLRLFTCINISDSLNDGISYFYAEVRRLKELLTLLKTYEKYPVCYCIDEIFRGTNNRERLQGSRALIRKLATFPAAGLISTHDLELVQLEEEIPQLKNYHFREHIEGQKMVFDYKLRPGPSPTTNALKIMEMEGLPVE